MGLFRHHTILLLIFTILAATRASAQTLSLHLDGDHLHVTAPQFHFLAGKALEKLRNGSTVGYVLRLAATPERTSRALFVAEGKFLVSFDLWEEKYSVVQDKPGGRTASRLTPASAEAWCLESIPIPVRSIPDRQPFMIRLECYIKGNEGNENGESPSGLTLAALIDVFSRKKEDRPLRWEAVAGPFLLEDLKETKKVR